MIKKWNVSLFIITMLIMFGVGIALAAPDNVQSDSG
jgi:hypothetical protein